MSGNRTGSRGQQRETEESQIRKAGLRDPLHKAGRKLSACHNLIKACSCGGLHAPGLNMRVEAKKSWPFFRQTGNQLFTVQTGVSKIDNQQPGRVGRDGLYSFCISINDPDCLAVQFGSTTDFRRREEIAAQDNNVGG